MKYKTKELVKKELIEIFDIDNNLHNGTTESNGCFCISKKQMGRFEVVRKLRMYFKGVRIEDGYLEVDSLTFIHTAFKIKSGVPPKFRE